MRIREAVVLATTALALAPMVAGCGGPDDSGGPTSTHTAPNGDVYNDADVTFAQQMVPHHAQAIEMVDLTRGRDVSPEVEALAAQVMAAQTPEIETMTTWLTAWNEEVPETSRDHANAHDEGHDAGIDLPGMMSEEEMESLETASDAEFENIWLEMMVEHHEGAIEIARTEQDDGKFPEAIAMAEDIEASQAAEADQMKALLAS
jgi:uncharacterized protein (DUF305 family)